jgi:hypothetical protein
MSTRKSSAKSAVTKSVTEKNARPAPSILADPIPTEPKEPESPENRPPEAQVDFAELEGGALVETVEDPADPNRTLFAISDGGLVRLADRVEDRGRILMPTPRSALGFSDVRLPQGVMPYESINGLALTIASLIQQVIDVPEPYAALLSTYVPYTWVADCLPIAVYLAIVGLPQSGKSTLLELLSLLCRRALLVSDISQAAAHQACKFSPTLLIDEIDWRSSRTMSSFRQLLRAGTSPSLRALRVRQSSGSFGPKVFGSLEASPDPALNSRCIQLVMAETKKSGLPKSHDPAVVKAASELQQKLLKFRFDSYKSIRPAQVPGAEELRPRSQDILSSLAAPLVGNPLWTHGLFAFIKEQHDLVTRDPLEPRFEGLHAAIWDVIHREPPPSSIRIGGEPSLKTLTNQTLLRAGERLSVSDKAVGGMVSSMGFRSTQRTNYGWILWLDSDTRERCHQLLKTHGNRYIQDWDFAQHSTTCPLCKELAAPAGT